MGRLVILSGPSCVGKGPLCAALERLHPQIARALQPVALYNSRAPRPGERDGVDYHFRPRSEVEALRARERFLVLEVRGDLHALDVGQLESQLASGDVFFEGNPFVARGLLALPLPAAERLSVFLSPLSREEVLCLKAPERHVALPDLVAELMRRKLLRRTLRHKGILSQSDLADVERRAVSAYVELKEAWRFQYVIANHDGEDSENWDAFYYPIGDARKTVAAFAELLTGRVPPSVEQWEHDLLP